MKLFSRLFSKGASDILDGASNVLDRVVTNDQEKMQAKNEISQIVLNALNQLNSAQKEVLLKEMDGNWLQKSWRPIIMLSFGFIVVYAYFLQPAFFPNATDVANTLKPEFWELLKLGLGGYVIGRSVEKVSKNVTANVDMPFLKKKDRKDVVG